MLNLLGSWSDGRNESCLSFLTDSITSLILIETGMQVLILQSREEVGSEIHQGLLDEVNLSSPLAYCRSGLQLMFRKIVVPQIVSVNSLCSMRGIMRRR